jgi:hypothetical protein
MWNSVLVLALVTAADPLRLIATFVVMSRRRPVQNLLAYLAGCLIINGFILLIPLIVLHFTPPFKSFVQDLAGSTVAGGSTVQPVPIGMGVLTLLIAAVMAVRLRVRQRADASTTGYDASNVLVCDEPLASPPEPTTKESAVRRLLGRVSDAWEKGSLWVSVLMGMAYSPVQVTIALTIIATSGAALGTQLSAAIVFVVAILAIVEIILITCLVAPARTEAVLRSLHDVVQARRLEVVAAVSAIGGLALIVTGVGIL